MTTTDYMNITELLPRTRNSEWQMIERKFLTTDFTDKVWNGRPRDGSPLNGKGTGPSFTKLGLFLASFES
jgi:hypothetical protein